MAHTFNRGLVVLAALLVASAAHAQAWPAKAVRVITQFTAGGPGDVLTRGSTDVLSRALGQPFLVDNRPGAEGIIAGEACAKSAPDGYTLCASDSFAVSINPVLRLKMPYDPLRDNVPIILWGFLPSAIFVQPSLGVGSLRELFELARAKPGAITFASWGPSSSANLYMEWLRKEKGISFLNVPYKSAPAGWQGLQGGEVNVAIFATAFSVAQVRAGKVKALANINPARSKVLPEVPTHREAGLDMDIWTWFGMFAPAGTPAEVIRRVNATLVADFFGNPALKEKFLVSQDYDLSPPAGGTPEQFAAFLKADRENMARLAAITGVKAE
jgi:tripartite-type tricarboxylate transporter receptor subunit TctC